MVRDGIVVHLVELSSVNDKYVQEACVEAMCTLLCAKELAEDILAAGGLEVFIRLSMAELASPSLLQQCAHALFNVSCFANPRLQIVKHASSINSLSQLAERGNVETKRLVALVMRNLACYTTYQKELVAQGAAAICIQLLKPEQNEVRENAAAALFYLSRCDHSHGPFSSLIISSLHL